jgi:hypothetical protein
MAVEAASVEGVLCDGGGERGGDQAVAQRLLQEALWLRCVWMCVCVFGQSFVANGMRGRFPTK